jgi:tetratricopeptide (TPR) repeat protein/tRNA A-37 threonylcarbamoyl transferase component Bud32
MGADRWQQLSALLDELFDLAAEPRAARLAEIAAQDSALAAELTRLLAADARLGALDTGAAHAAPSLMSGIAGSQPAGAGPQSEAGRQVGQYRLLERVGSGGMGEIWRAERTNDFEQVVAIKLMRPLFDSVQLRERFARERRILARLDHPNIARLLDGGVGDDGTPWFAMEFVRGTHLVQYAQERALGVRERVELLLQVCDAVAHAQTQLLVHRDLKPSNVLVDAEGRVRVLDFGIARLLDDTGESQLTGTGVRVFSPAYAAPEQIRGDMVGTPADVFALGAVLYELLTGQVPHPQRTGSPDRLIAGLQDEVAPRPSAAHLATDAAAGRAGSRLSRHTGALDGDLDTIVATALQPDPARRYAGAAQLADDLRNWLDGRPISARPDTTGYRVRKFVARHRVAVGSASAVLLALIAGFGTALWQASVALQQAARAEAEAERATVEAAKATAIKDFLIASFDTAQIGERTQAEGASTTVLQLIEHSGNALLEDDTLDPEVRLELLTALGELQRINGLNEQAERLQLKALEISRQHHGARSEKYVYALVERGTNLAQLGQDEESNRVLDEAIAIMEAVALQHTESYPFALWRRGVNAYAMERLDEALALFERAEAACIWYRPTDSTRAAALQWQANVHQLRDRFDAAETALRKAVALAPASERPEQSEGLARLYLGDLNSRRGQFAEAMVDYERALQLMRETDAGGRNPDRAVLLANMARVRHETGQREAALADVRDALDIARLHTGGEPGRRLEDRARTALLVVHLGEGEPAAALPLARELNALWPPDSVDPVRAAHQVLLAEAELLGGQARAARVAAERAVSIREAIDPDTLVARHARLVLAETLERLGDAAAQDTYRRVLEPAHADATSPLARARATQQARALAGLARIALASDRQAALRHARDGLARLPEPRYASERRVYEQLRALETSAR